MHPMLPQIVAQQNYFSTQSWLVPNSRCHATLQVTHFRPNSQKFENIISKGKLISRLWNRSQRACSMLSHCQIDVVSLSRAPVVFPSFDQQNLWKARVPSWTDRVLWRSFPEPWKCFLSDSNKVHVLSCRVTLEKYLFRSIWFGIPKKGSEKGV